MHLHPSPSPSDGVWSSLISAVSGPTSFDTVFHKLDNDTSKIEKEYVGAWKALAAGAPTMQIATVRTGSGGLLAMPSHHCAILRFM